MKRPGQQAVQPIAEPGDHENHQRPKVVAIHQMDHDEWNKNHPQQGELVGGGKDLREFHARPLGTRAPGVCSSSLAFSGSALDGASAAEGCNPVLAKKRCDSEGRFPSGKSSSTRSMRCMGKKTTAGVNGSPSRTITARSSKEASSAPLRLSPSGASARIIPQNFSRGLHRVAITRAPGRNGSRVSESGNGSLDEFFTTLRLSPGEARIANLVPARTIVGLL